jgi:hypothetical protein
VSFWQRQKLIFWYHALPDLIILTALLFIPETRHWILVTHPVEAVLLVIAWVLIQDRVMPYRLGGSRGKPKKKNREIKRES